jgi:hypothetical protein
MDYLKLHNQVRKEFSEEVAVCTTVVTTILMTTKPKSKDFDEEKGFSKRIEYISREALWEINQIYNSKIVDIAVAISQIWYTWDLYQSVGKQTTIKELVDGLQRTKN